MSCTHLCVQFDEFSQRSLPMQSPLQSHYKTSISPKVFSQSPTTAPGNCQSTFCHRGYFTFPRILRKWNHTVCVLSCRLLSLAWWFWDSPTRGLYRWLVSFLLLSAFHCLGRPHSVDPSTLSFLKHCLRFDYRRNSSCQPSSLGSLVSLTPTLEPQDPAQFSSYTCYTDSHSGLTLCQGFQHLLEPNTVHTVAFLPSPTEHVCILFLSLL